MNRLRPQQKVYEPSAVTVRNRILPTQCMYMFRMVFTTNIINWLDFTMETVSVYCAAGTRVLFHTCSLCTSACIWGNKREIENVYWEWASDFARAFVCVCVNVRSLLLIPSAAPLSSSNPCSKVFIHSTACSPSSVL